MRMLTTLLTLEQFGLQIKHERYPLLGYSSV
jgi:hypothetical protein